jgi:hypothetical protein
MEQEIDTNALGEAIVKKIKNNLRPWDSCGYLWIRINLRCNGKYRLRSKNSDDWPHLTALLQKVYQEK